LGNYTYGGSNLMEEAIKEVKNIAIYLRKSRGDEEEDVLAKHRDKLLEYAKKRGWKYVIYQEEIKSGEEISNRPECLRMLDDIVKRLYLGVLVMDIDRISRGDGEDAAKVYKVLKYANTHLITPTKDYDLHNNSDRLLLDFKSLFANQELQIITERFRNGKEAAIKKGRLANGRPAYPYFRKYFIVKMKKIKVKQILA
jgi:site-specific DNA recombinase